MTVSRSFTRRGILAGLAGTVLAPAPGLAQRTDLRGFDPLWRDAEDAIRAFFGDVTYGSDGLSLDLPDYSDAGSTVAMTVRGALPGLGPTLQVVHVVAHKNPTPHVLSVWFSPLSGRAELSTRIRLETSQKVTAVARMSDGSHRRIDRDVTVAFGACAQIGDGSDDDVAVFRPQPKVSVPATAAAGDVVTVRALISHPMETGLRLSATQEWIRQRIVSRFSCAFEGQEVIRVRLYPAVSTNPYFQFHARVERSGRFAFEWYDTTDETYTATAPITVR
jgi:sulfur-oxidizing protein SoxY